MYNYFIERIKEVIAKYWAKGRDKISQVVCEGLNWCQPNGCLKEVAYREALRKMAKLGLVTLPFPNSQEGNPLTVKEVTFPKPSRANSNLLTPSALH